MRYLDTRLDSIEGDLEYRTPGDTAVAIDELPWEPGQGQTVYVPVYSHVYHQRSRRQLLTATLSVRNTDLKHEIVVTSVRYYDTSGEEVRSYLDEPLQVGPLATVDFVVEHDDVGGRRHNFIVTWTAGKPVTEPVVEAVMIDTSGQQGISFARRGTVISARQQGPK